MVKLTIYYGRAGQRKKEREWESRPFNDGNNDEGGATRGVPSCCDAVLLLCRAGIYTREDIGLFTKMLSGLYLYNFFSLQIETLN